MLGKGIVYFNSFVTYENGYARNLSLTLKSIPVSNECVTYKRIKLIKSTDIAGTLIQWTVNSVMKPHSL